MLFAIASLFGMLVLLDRAVRIERLRLLKLKKQYQLFALRDELRNAAIEGEIEMGRWFECVDTTLTRVIESLDMINIYEMTGLLYVHRHDEELREALERLKEALDNPKNKKLKEIFVLYGNTMLEFLYDRHYVLINTVTTTDRIYKWTKKAKQIFLDLLMSAPETSTLTEHC